MFGKSTLVGDGLHGAHIVLGKWSRRLFSMPLPINLLGVRRPLPAVVIYLEIADILNEREHHYEPRQSDIA